MQCSWNAFWKCLRLYMREWKEVKYMMAMLWAQQIMLGKKTFTQVPAKLREQVKELLTDSGCGELAE